MAVYKYLDPGDREQNISYWRSLDADISADLSTVETEEPLAKTGRTRPLNLGGRFLIVMYRLRLRSHADHLSTSTVSKILITWIIFMYLVDISSGGAITFVSQLYTGSISDWGNCQEK